MIITDKQKEILEKNIPDIQQYYKRDVNTLLEKIDDAIVDNIVDNNDEPDETGILLQRVYDEIDMQNL